MMEVVESGIPRSVVPDLKIDSVKFVDCPGTTIGTRVDCGGDLIVNQFLRVEGSSSQPANLNLKALKELLVKDSTYRFSWRSVLNSRILFVSFCLTILIAGGIVGVVQLVKNYSTNDSNEEESLPMNYTLRFKSRSDWSAYPSIGNVSLTFHPARYVVVCSPGGISCNEPIYCQTLIKGLQTEQLEEGYTDIFYNFLIGGDGYIYEGRGWTSRGDHTYGINCASIGVGFIYDTTSNLFNRNMNQSLYLLIEEGISTGQLSKDYKLFSRTQIVDDNSDLDNRIMNIVKPWKHFSQVTKDDFICE